MLSYAERILGLTAELDKRVSELTGAVSGPLLLGCSMTIAEFILPRLAEAYWEKGVELRGCERTRVILGNKVVAATEDDWFTEYSAPILAIKVVKDLD